MIRKITKFLPHILQTILYMVLFGYGGYQLGLVASTQSVLYALFLLVLMGVFIFVSIMIHEAGHLVFGLLSGYTFSSFRILHFMWYKVDGKIKQTRYSVPGTAGQCLMIPPSVEVSTPYFWYHVGGGLMNIIASLLTLPFYLVFQEHQSIFFLFMWINFSLAVMNLIPMGDIVSNDGYNILNLYKSKEARKMTALSLHVLDAQVRGIRLKDMDSHYFENIDSGDLSNPMTSIGILYLINRELDKGNYDEAYRQMLEVLHSDSIRSTKLHTQLLWLEVIFFDLLNEDYHHLEEKFTKDLEKLALQLSKARHLQVIRFFYAYEKLYKRNEEAANKWLHQFETVSTTYPYKADVEVEKELLALAQQKSASILS